MSKFQTYNRHNRLEGNFKTYTTGFILSLFFTFLAYLITIKHAFTKDTIIVIISLAAVIQFAIQLIFFLHLGKESRPRYRLLVFAIMLMIVLILVIGSLWIMANLNHDMTIKQMEEYMVQQGNGGI